MEPIADLSRIYQANHDLIPVAHQKLPQDVWDYICGGAETETTLRRNRQSLDVLAFRPRVLRDVSVLDVSTTFYGHKLRIPVLLAPMGQIQRMTSGGAVAPDSAAEHFGTMNIVSTTTSPDLAVTAANSPHAKMFQIYVRGDKQWLRDLVRRAKGAGYKLFALTVDSAYYGNRERLNPHQVVYRDGVPERVWQASVTWDHVKLIQDELGGGIPFLLKGIQTAEDAALALEHKVDGIYISNHGGRQMDHALGCMDTLPEVVTAVNKKVPIVVDGGFARGTDVLKALALGADAVAIGRLQAWALGAHGASGLVRCLELLEREMQISMGLLGITKLADLNPSYVTRTIAAAPSHEMSAFPHVQGAGLDGRIL
jgi:isopentenyl diphosphate isomerase/L-lactate dehydrogenase-like FMN-dependent dehydrogenase